MIYEFQVLDHNGEPTQEIVERTYRVAERPDVIELPDGRIAKRIVSKSSFILNGSCWYKDSYSR